MTYGFSVCLEEMRLMKSDLQEGAVFYGVRARTGESVLFRTLPALPTVVDILGEICGPPLMASVQAHAQSICLACHLSDYPFDEIPHHTACLLTDFQKLHRWGERFWAGVGAKKTVSFFIRQRNVSNQSYDFSEFNSAWIPSLIRGYEQVQLVDFDSYIYL